MLLKRMDNHIETTKNQVEFELFAEDLLFVSIDNDVNEQLSIPSYWRRRGRKVNPPLEIGINTETGAIKRIAVFIDSADIKEYSININQTSHGSVSIDSSIFTRANDFVDTDGGYFVFLTNKKLVCLFDEVSMIEESIESGNMGIYVDSSGYVIGFSIDNLAENQIKMISCLNIL